MKTLAATRRPLADRAVAFHEAGHAVVGFHEELRLKRMTIDSEGDAHGSVDHDNPARGAQDYEMTPRQASRLMSTVRTSLAGEIAQKRALPLSVRSWQVSSDRKRACELVDWILREAPRPASPELADAYLRAAQIEASLILELRWNLVEALAEALLERRTMTGKEVEALLRAQLRNDAKRAGKGGHPPRL